MDEWTNGPTNELTTRLNKVSVLVAYKQVEQF